MTSLAGTGSLVRLILRLDRVRLTVWIAALALVPVATASFFQSVYGTQAGREQFATTIQSNPAFSALFGPLRDSSIGGLTAWRVGTHGVFLVGLMAILTMIRHTRDDEETGGRELLASTVVGRNAPLAAAVIVVVGAGVLIGGGTTAGLAGLGLTPAGAIAYGAGFAAAAAAFAGVGAIAAQLTQAGSTARGVGIGIVGVFFLIRMAGDTAETAGLEWLSWLSPIGWFSHLRPFADERWWVLALWVGFAASTTAIAVVISSRRDVGEGAFPPRPGPSRAGNSLRSPSGLAWRLQRGSLLGWTVGLAALGGVYGAGADSFADISEENPRLEELLASLGGVQTFIDSYSSAAVGLAALVATAYSISSVLKLISEEDTLRSELVLATATSRSGHAWSHLVYGLAGPVLILVVSGAVAGAIYGSIIGDVGGQLPRVLAAALSHIPAVWVVTGITLTLYGLIPKLSSVSWGVLASYLLLDQLGPVLQWPQWSLNLSPFTHIPIVPAEDFVATPIVVLLVIATGLLISGLIGFRARDIPA